MTPLRRRMIEDMQIRNLAPRTQVSYVEQVDSPADPKQTVRVLTIMLASEY